MYPSLSNLSLKDASPTGKIKPTLNPDNKIEMPPRMFETMRTDADGDCFYHAMASLADFYSHQLAERYYDKRTGTTNVFTIRADTANAIRNNWDSMVGLHPELRNKDRDAFANSVLASTDPRKKNKWAGEPEIDALVSLFKDIKVSIWIDVNGNFYYHSLAYPNNKEGELSKLKTWHVLHNGVAEGAAGGTHYDWLRPYVGPDEKPYSLDEKDPRLGAGSSRGTFVRLPSKKKKPSSTPDQESRNRDLREMAKEREARQAMNPTPPRAPTPGAGGEDMDEATQREIQRILEEQRQEEESAKLARRLSEREDPPTRRARPPPPSEYEYGPPGRPNRSFRNMTNEQKAKIMKAMGMDEENEQ